MIPISDQRVKTGFLQVHFKGKVHPTREASWKTGKSGILISKRDRMRRKFLVNLFPFRIEMRIMKASCL